jgi:hypothetical protein
MPTTESREVRYITIFIHPPTGKEAVPFVSTSPERLTVRRGDIVDWTIVDVTGKVPVSKVTVVWRGKSPVEKDPYFRRRFARATVAGPKGIYKYSIAIAGKVVFDPEVEVMN